MRTIDGKQKDGSYLAFQDARIEGKKKTIKAEGEEREVFPFVLTKQTPDREGDRVIISGLNIDNYRNNPVVYKNHDTRSEPIGITYNVRKEGDEVKGDVWFHEITEESKEQKKLVEKGVKRAGSIGFRVYPNSYKQVPATASEKETWGWDRINDIVKSELYEFSIVGIGMHQSALAAKSLTKTIEENMTKDMTIDDALEVIKTYEKEGAELSSKNRSKIQKIRDITGELLGVDKELEERLDQLEKEVSELSERNEEMEAILVDADEEIESEEKSELLTSEQILEKFYNNKQEAEDAKDNTND